MKFLRQSILKAHPLKALLTAALFQVVLTSCVSQNTTDAVVGNTAPALASAPASASTGTVLSIVAGNYQTGAPGVTFSTPLKVQLLNNGVPMPGLNINFNIISGPAATISAPSGTTDASGMVQTNVTPAAAPGNLMIRASYLSFTADFTLNLVTQTNATLTKISGDVQSANVAQTLTNPFVVETRDVGTSLPLANILVRFTVSTGNGKINSSTNTIVVSSDGVGRASINFDVGPIGGANAVTATIVSVPAQTTTFNSTGVVPVGSAVDLSQSDVVSASPTLTADGSQTTTLTLRTKDAYGNIIPVGGKAVVLTVNTGTLLGGVVDHANGTYTQSIRAPSTLAVPAILASGTVAGSALTSPQASVTLLSGAIDLTQSKITSSAPNVTADGASTVLMTATLKDSLGNQLTVGGSTIVFSSTIGILIGGVTDNGNGTYTQTLRSGTVTGTAVISATVGGGAISTTKSVTFLAGAPDITKSTIVATPSTIQPNGSSTTIVTVQLRDANNNFCSTATGHSITLTKASGTWMGTGLNVVSAGDNGDGTYSAVLIAPNTPGSTPISGTDNGSILAKTGTVYFSSGATGPNVSTSTISVTGANPAPADGATTVSIKVSLKDSFGSPLNSGGSVVTIASTAGTLVGSVLDNGDGTYTQNLRAPAASAIATISATVDSGTLAKTASQNFYGTISLSQSNLTSAPGSIVANGSSVSVVYLNAKDANGISIPVGGVAGISFSSTFGVLLGGITDNGNGTYSQQLQSTAIVHTAVVSASKGGSAFSGTVNVDFYAPNNRAGLTIDCLNIATYQNTTLLVDSGTLTLNSKGPNGTCPANFTFNGIVLQNSAILTHGTCTETQEYGLELTSNYITIDATSKIDVTGKGYPMSSTAYQLRTQGNQNVYATGSDRQVGGSYGGQGASNYGAGAGVNQTYGSLYEPVELGTSGATTYGQNSGAGGGRLKITVTGASGISNSGAIRADGGKVTSGHSGGAGSGGSVWINTTTLSGSGFITAAGAGTDASGTLKYAGGGGRIAVYYGALTDLSGNFSYPSGVLTNISAAGGFGTGTCAGGAGTVYLKSTSQTYGDLIIDNKVASTCSTTLGTVINSPSISANEVVTSTTLTKTNAFIDSYSTNTPFKNWYLDPNPAQNMTPTKTDNQLYKITGATSNVATTTGGDMTVVSSVGNAAELVLQFDNLEIGDHTPISAGNLRILSYNGDLRSNDATSVTMTDTMPPAGVEYVGAQNITINLNTKTMPQFLVEDFSNVTLTVSNGTFNFSNLKAKNFVSTSMTLTGTSLRTFGNVTFSGTTATFSQNVGSYSIQADGTFDASVGSVINQAATTITLEHSLEILASSISISANSSMNAIGTGFIQVTNYKSRVFGNQDVIAYNNSTNIACGGSHGGRGGCAGSPYYAAEVYGSYKNPYTSGGSAGWYISGGTGGGIIRLIATSNGPVTVNGTVSSVGGSNSFGGAGGSIYVSGGLISGTGTLDARGGNAVGGGNWAGGGGRVALYYTSLGGNFTYPSNALANIKVWGGNDGTANTASGGSPGTLFMKASTDTYGKLLINNNNQVLPDISGRHVALNFPTGYTSTGISYNAGTGKSTITSPGAFGEKYGASNAFVGMFLNPNIAQNATPQISDDTLFEIVGQTANTLTVLGDVTGIAGAGNTFQINAKLDTLKVIGNSILEVNGGVVLANDLQITNGQVVGTGSIETYPTLATTLNPNGGTINLNSFGNSGALTLQNGTFVLPNNSNITTTGNLTLSSATMSGTGLNYNVTGTMNLISSTLNASTITTSQSLNLTASTLTSTGAITVGQDLLVTSYSALNQSVGSTITTTGNLTVSSTSTLKGQTLAVGGNLLVDSTGTIAAGNRVLTPFTTYNTVSNINVTGTATVSNGSNITVPYGTATEEYYLYITAPNITLDATSTLNLDGKGYVNVTQQRFRGLGNTDSQGYISATNSPTANDAAAGAYGGIGGSAGYNGYYSNKTYGNFQSPIYLGTSDSCWDGAACGHNGGGAVRLNISGTSLLNGTITANGLGGGGNYASASGGSVYIQTGTLSGSGAIRTNGGVSGSYGGGGGGRIAIYYTSTAGGFALNATRIANVQSLGGVGGNTTLQGAAGTVYFKQNTQTYGDMIINNNNADSLFITPLIPSLFTTVGSVTSTTMNSANSWANPYGNVANFFQGFYLNPNTAGNATAKLSDDTLFPIISNTANQVTTSGTNMNIVSSPGNPYLLYLVLDNLEVANKGKLFFAGQNIYVMSGDLSTNDTATFRQDGGITANVVDLGPGVVWNTTANASGAVTTQCSSNHACP